MIIRVYLQNARSIYHSKINQCNNHINSLKRKNLINNLNSYRKIFGQISKTLSKVMTEGNSLNLLKNIQYVNKFGKLSSGLRTGKGPVFIPIPKKGNDKECSNYCTIALISDTSKAQNYPSQASAIHKP